MIGCERGSVGSIAASRLAGAHILICSFRSVLADADNTWPACPLVSPTGVRLTVNYSETLVSAFMQRLIYAYERILKRVPIGPNHRVLISIWVRPFFWGHVKFSAHHIVGIVGQQLQGNLD